MALSVCFSYQTVRTDEPLVITDLFPIRLIAEERYQIHNTDGVKEIDRKTLRETIF